MLMDRPGNKERRRVRVRVRGESEGEGEGEGEGYLATTASAEAHGRMAAAGDDFSDDASPACLALALGLG